MTLALLSPGQPDRAIAVQRRSEDRWSMPERIGRFSLGMGAVIFASFALHALVVATAVMSGRGAVAPQQEIAVELVREVPAQEPEKPKPAPLADRGAPANVAPSSVEPPKAEQPKAEQSKPDTAKLDKAMPDPAKPQPAGPQPVTPEPPKDAAKVEEKPAPLKPEPPNQQATVEPPRSSPAAEPPKPADDEMEALRSQLDALKAEHAALQSEQAAQALADAAARTAASSAEAGLGPLPESFQAVALPATGAAADEVVGYQQIVFSQLAKAKEIGQWKGASGTAGVRFSIDDTGKLLDVEIVHESGLPALDAEALAIVRRAAPFPPPPPGARRSFDANVNAAGEPAR